MPRYQFHPACLLFPRVSDEALQELAEDIQVRGLLHDIVCYKGKILDGRNRLAACEIAGVEPRFVEWSGTGSPTEWVISENLIRRHLTSSQKAVIAHDLLPMLEKEAKDRQRQSQGRGKKGAKELATFSGKASGIAARIARTNATYVEQVKSVSQQAPELLDHIRSGCLTVPDAITLAPMPTKTRTAVLRAIQSTRPKKKLKRIIREAELAAMRSTPRPSVNGRARRSKSGDIEIWCGDCLKLMPTIAVKSVSLVVTSPPFNLGLKYNSYHDDRRMDEYLSWLEKVFKAIKRVLRDDGSFFLNMGSSRKRPWNAMRVAEVAGRHFVLQNDIVWVKSITLDGYTCGHFAPLAGDRFLNHSFESIYHFTKSGDVKIDRLAIGVPYGDGSNLLRNTACGDLRCGGDVWFVPYETIHDGNQKGLHPAVFPVELAARCIRLAGLCKNMLVLDPFAGTGSTLAACRDLGVGGIGIEIDAAYCKKARKRVAKK